MPYKNPAARAAYRKRYDAAHRSAHTTRKRAERHAHAKPFVGVDGEGGNVGRNYGARNDHVYLLLRAGKYVLESGSPLSTEECLNFLTELPQGYEYVSYFFTYDVTMILRDLPTETISSLLNRAARTYDPAKPPKRVRWKEYLLDWLPGKEFRVRRLTQKDWIVISDVGSFFQTSFVAALEKWNVGSDALRARIAASKDKRSKFMEITELTRLYNKKECDLLAELMTEFRSVIGSVGPFPTYWQGPGNLASAWLRYHDVPDSKNVPYEAMNMARNAYYGGRFEITGVGTFRRPIYQYDINSAYPAAIRNLPCLVHGGWKHSRMEKPRRRLYVARCKFSHLPGRFLGTLPVRTQQGNICYPRQGEGTYWSPEIEAARRAGATIEILESWEYIPDCKCKPLQWINDIYTLRQQVGKTSKGMALKLALNSIYGKFAQSIGNPRWANPVWAGIITATCRALIIDACAQVDERSILMIATDGIFSDVPLDLPLSKELGEWELTEHQSMFIIQPGLYLLPTEKPKTRGIPRVKIEEYARQIRRVWAEPGDKPTMTHTIPLHRFRAAREAVHQNRWIESGEWYTQERAVSYDWKTKRSEEVGDWDTVWSGYKKDRPAWRPAIIDDGGLSVNYGKSIGTWERDRTMDNDQPEEADILA